MYIDDVHASTDGTQSIRLVPCLGSSSTWAACIVPSTVKLVSVIHCFKRLKQSTDLVCNILWIQVLLFRRHRPAHAEKGKMDILAHVGMQAQQQSALRGFDQRQRRQTRMRLLPEERVGHEEGWGCVGCRCCVLLQHGDGPFRCFVE